MSEFPDWPDLIARTSATLETACVAGVALPPGCDEVAWHVASAGTAWPLQIDYGAGGCDRRADLLSGPLFTSGNYPWPRLNNKWCEPVLQMDLTRLGLLGGRDVGEGLLQVWEASTDGLIRVIPLAAREEPLSPVPSEKHTDYEEVMAGHDWETNRPDWLDKPGRITGFGEPFYNHAGYHLRRTLQCIVEGEAEVGRSILSEPFQAILKSMGEPEPDNQHRVFGMCAGNILNTANQLPPVLLTIESDERVFSAMGSTLCVCYERKAEGFAYSAHFFWE